MKVPSPLTSPVHHIVNIISVLCILNIYAGDVFASYREPSIESFSSCDIELKKASNYCLVGISSCYCREM